MPVAQILAGGPGRDSIRAVAAPEFASVEEATWVTPSTPVVGVAWKGEAKAYPVHLLEYHLIVNDRFGSDAVAVTYDPLTAVPRAYVRRRGERELEFGVSGLVYNSGFLMYDRVGESLWSQFSGRALAGSDAGASLPRIRVRQEPMAVWLERQPDTRVLARPEPRRIDYGHSPFSSYWISETIPFPVAHRDDRFHPKEVVLGIEIEGRRRAYLGSRCTAAGGRIRDEVAGRTIQIVYDSNVGVFMWEAPEEAFVTDAYWFAWKAFHPDSELWEAGP
ncbi:MAG: DUF3179 domain-containing protein [Proteobacteria bacterium]|nr:DUF3179 domain-containing protein [Pseudomonadota bacterium]